MNCLQKEKRESNKKRERISQRYTLNNQELRLKLHYGLKFRLDYDDFEAIQLSVSVSVPVLLVITIVTDI